MPRNHVYRIGIVVIFFISLYTPVSYLLLGKIEKGRVIDFVYRNSGISLLPASTYPKIEFHYQDQAYIILGEENQEFELYDKVDVIFYKGEPQKAKIYTFWGLMADPVIELPIGLLIWWALFKSFPNLFDPTKKEGEIENQTIKRRYSKRESKISDATFGARILIYFLVLIISMCLTYGVWIVYQGMISGKITYQIGIGISILILVILGTIIQKVVKG